MRSLAGSLTDGALADAILLLAAHRYRPPTLGRYGSSKIVQKLVIQKPFSSK